MYKIILPIIVVALFVVGFFIVRDNFSKIRSEIQAIKTQPDGMLVEKNVEKSSEKSGCDESCQKQIANEVARAVATLSGTNKIITVTPAPISTVKPQDTYIQISGSGSTQNSDWTDVTGTDFSFDVTRDFGKGVKFAWEGFLRIANANGTAYARIYDVTHGIGVDGSQISIANQADFTRANSTNMNFWAGRNLYRVQIKSLNTFNVDYMGGKIRVSY